MPGACVLRVLDRRLRVCGGNLTPRSTRTRADVPPSAHAVGRAPVTGHVRPWVKDHPLNNSRVMLHHVFGEPRGQLRSPLSKHWRGTASVCAATGRLRPPRTSWHRLFTTRSTAPVMVFRTVPFGDNHVRLNTGRVRRFSRSGALLSSWPASRSLAPRFAGARAACNLSAVGGQPNFALVRTGRQHRASIYAVLARRTARRYSA